MSEEKYPKCIQCHICKCTFSIAKEGLPEDLYDLIKKYNNDQLIWLCKKCKERADCAFYFLTVAEKQRSLEREISELKNAWETSSQSISELKDDVRRLSIASLNNLHDRNSSNVFNNSHLPNNSILNTQPHIYTPKQGQIYSPVPENCQPRVILSAIYEPANVSVSSQLTTQSNQGLEINPKSNHSFSVIDNFERNDNTPDPSSSRGSSIVDASENISVPPQTSSIGRVENKVTLSIIKDIFKQKIKIDDNESSNSKELVLTFLKQLLSLMKENDEFNCLFEKWYPTGSSFEGLRITNATEYDIDIILKFPAAKGTILKKIEFFSKTKSFAKLRWDVPASFNESAASESDKIVLKFLRSNSDGNLLNPVKIQAWMQSVVTKTLQKFTKYPDTISKVRNHKSGPAQTIDLDINDGTTISIDLVPVFRFGYPDEKEILLVDDFKRYDIKKDHKFWFLVPKQCEGVNNMTEAECRVSWRLHFMELERHILYDMSSVKPIIKMLKRMRDEANHKQLASYYLKTVLLWQVKENPNQSYWAESFLYERFLESLEKLTSYLKDAHLPYFFDPDYNLINKLSKDSCTNYACWFKKVSENIKKNPSSLGNYL